MGGFGGGNPFMQQPGAAFGGSQSPSGFGFCQPMSIPPSRAAFGSSSQGFGSNAGMGGGSRQQQHFFGSVPQQQSTGSSSLFGGFPQQQSTGSSSLFGFGQQQSGTGFGGQQHVGASFGGQQQVGASFGGQQRGGAGFGGQQRGGASFGRQQHGGASFGGQQSNLMFGSVSNFHNEWGACRGGECMIVGFTTTYAISAYHHWSCEFMVRCTQYNIMW